MGTATPQSIDVQCDNQMVKVIGKSLEKSPDEIFLFAVKYRRPAARPPFGAETCLGRHEQGKSDLI